MKLTSIIALNEGAYSKLAEWEATAKKLGYTVTKDNKTGTYHAWDKTSHKGRFNAPTSKGSLTEGILNKIVGKVMGQAPTHKYKVGDDVSYEMDPPQEGGRGKGKITSVSKAGDHYTVNGKFVNHFEIKKKHNNESVSEGDSHLHKALDRALSKEKKASPAQVQRNKERWAKRQAQTGVEESAGEPNVDAVVHYLTSGYHTLQKYADSYQDFSIITRIYNVLRMDLKGGNYIAFSQSYNNYLERYPVAASELYGAMFEAAGLPADEGTIEEFLQKCSGVTEGMAEGLDKQALKQQLDKINAQMALSHPRHQNPNSPTSNRYFELKKQKDEIIAQLKQGVTQEGFGDTIKRGVKKLTTPVKDPILDQMKSIADTANKRTRDAQNVQYASKAVKEAYTGHFNDDDWYEVDPKTNTVLRHAGGHADYRPTATGQPIKLPNGNVLMRGMRAKDLRGVTESTSPFRKGDTVTITADSKYKGEKCKVLSVDRGFEMLEVTMIKFPGSHIRSDWRNFSKTVKELGETSTSTQPEYKYPTSC